MFNLSIFLNSCAALVSNRKNLYPSPKLADKNSAILGFFEHIKLCYLVTIATNLSRREAWGVRETDNLVDTAGRSDV